MTKAAQAKTDTDKSTDEEEVKLAVISSIGTEGEVEIATLQKEMQAIGGTVNPTDGTFPVTVTKGSYKMEVTQTGNLEKPAQKVEDIAGTKLEETTKVRDVNGDVAYVPGGYMISDVKTNATEGTKTEQEIKSGLVIKDKAQNGNEWVWVQVSKSELTNNMLTSASARLCDSSTTTNKYSKIWNFTLAGREIYSIVSGSYTYKAGIPGQSYDSTTKTGYYREPDVLNNSSYDANPSYYNIILNENTKNLTVDLTKETQPLNLLAKQFVNDYNNMIKSIENYGGFYIGRYELSGDSSNPKVVRYGASGGINWYNSYVACSKFTNKDAIGTMIWGTQWDATLEWLAESYEKYHEEDKTIGKPYGQIADSSGWGNYSNSQNFQYKETADGEVKTKSSSTLIPTGSTEYTKANNIYDLAGNCMEWTQEACSTYFRVLRRRLLRQ